MRAKPAAIDHVHGKAPTSRRTPKPPAAECGVCQLAGALPFLKVRHLRPSGFTIRCEWGEWGVRSLLPTTDVFIIVDVLSFSTCVDIAVSRGATVWPYRWKDESARQFARAKGALLAGKRGDRYSLSPASLGELPADSQLVLPSPNGATLSLATAGKPTLCGCLRNASAVARAALSLGKHIAVIPAGERWPDDSLRPCFEDWIGGGAIIEHLPEPRSPERKPRWRRGNRRGQGCSNNSVPVRPVRNSSSAGSRRTWKSPVR